MAYYTKVDLARQAKLLSGDTAIFQGSISLSNAGSFTGNTGYFYSNVKGADAVALNDFVTLGQLNLFLPNGILSGFTLTLSGSSVIVSGGTYRLSGIIHTKSIFTIVSLDAQDVTLSRYDSIFIDSAMTISMVSGTLSANPTPPNDIINEIRLGDVLITPTTVTTLPTPIINYVTTNTNQIIGGSKSFVAYTYLSGFTNTRLSVLSGGAQVYSNRISGAGGYGASQWVAASNNGNNNTDAESLNATYTTLLDINVTVGANIGDYNQFCNYTDIQSDNFGTINITVSDNPNVSTGVFNSGQNAIYEVNLLGDARIDGGSNNGYSNWTTLTPKWHNSTIITDVLPRLVLQVKQTTAGSGIYQFRFIRRVQYIDPVSSTADTSTVDIRIYGDYHFKIDPTPVNTGTQGNDATPFSGFTTYTFAYPTAYNDNLYDSQGLRFLKQGDVITGGTGGTTYTFINGLTNITGNTIGLGGQLRQNTNIYLTGNTLSFLDGNSITGPYLSTSFAVTGVSLSINDLSGNSGSFYNTPAETYLSHSDTGQDIAIISTNNKSGSPMTASMFVYNLFTQNNKKGIQSKLTNAVGVQIVDTIDNIGLIGVNATGASQVFNIYNDNAQYVQFGHLELINTIISGMSTTASGTTAITTSGSYRINNLIYSINSSTNTTIPSQDATLSRYSIIYATTSSTLGVVNGTLSTSPVEPTIPNNTVLVAIILITPTSVTVNGGGGKKGTGTVTSVTSSTSDIGVVNSTTTPVLTLSDTGVIAGSYTNANLTVDSKGRISTISSGTSYSFTNGLTLSGTNVTWGGFLTGNTSINMSGNSVTFNNNGIGQPSNLNATGFILQNNTPTTGSTYQNSPALILAGTALHGGTSTSYDSRFALVTVGTNDVADYSYLSFKSSQDSGTTWSQVARIDDVGDMQVTTSVQAPYFYGTYNYLTHLYTQAASFYDSSAYAMSNGRSLSTVLTTFNSQQKGIILPQMNTTARNAISGGNYPQYVTVTNGGSGYTSAPSVVFSAPPTGSIYTAQGKAIIQSGKVVQVYIIDPGNGYTSPPTVSFSGGGGTGATAVVAAIPTGLAIFNIDSNQHEYYNGIAWVPFASGGTGVSLILTTSGTSGAATYSGGYLNIPQYSGSSYSFTNGLTNSSGVVSLGGSLTGATTISMSGNSISLINNNLGNLSNSGYNSNGFLLRNTTLGTSGITIQDSPPLILAGNYWNGTSSVDSRFSLNQHYTGFESVLNFNVSNDSGNTWTSVANLSASGQLSLPSINTNVLYAQNSATINNLYNGQASFNDGTGYPLNLGTTTSTRLVEFTSQKAGVMLPQMNTVARNKISGGTYPQYVTVTNGGTGYTSAPTVVFSNPPGVSPNPAYGTAIVQSGQVVQVYITAQGQGYTSLPTVSFTGGGGTGATAVVSAIPTGLLTFNIDNTHHEVYRGSGWEQIAYLSDISGATTFIQNQNITPQSANAWINGRMIFTNGSAQNTIQGDAIYLGTTATYNISSIQYSNINNWLQVTTSGNTINFPNSKSGTVALTSDISGATSGFTALNGTGYVKVSGTTVSYDSNNYLIANSTNYQTGPLYLSTQYDGVRIQDPTNTGTTSALLNNSLYFYYSGGNAYLGGGGTGMGFHTSMGGFTFTGANGYQWGMDASAGIFQTTSAYISNQLKIYNNNGATSATTIQEIPGFLQTGWYWNGTGSTQIGWQPSVSTVISSGTPVSTYKWMFYYGTGPTYKTPFYFDSNGIVTLPITPNTSTSGNYSYLTRNVTTGAIEIVSGGTTGGTSPIILTTSGTSGAATYSGGYLNIPQYTGTTYSFTNGILNVSGNTFGLGGNLTYGTNIFTNSHALVISGNGNGSTFSINDVDIFTTAVNTDFKDNSGNILLHLGNGSTATNSYASRLQVNGTPSYPTDVIRLQDLSGYTPTSGTSTGANPTASIGLTAVNGSASTYMRSDAAPALSQSISPNWTGYHTFNPTSTITSGGSNIVGIFPTINQSGSASYAALSIYPYEQSIATSGYSNLLLALGTTTGSGGTGTHTDKFKVDTNGNVNIVTGSLYAYAGSVYASTINGNINSGLNLQLSNTFSSAGSAIVLGSGSYITNTSGEFNMFGIIGVINQSGTSSYNGIKINLTEQNTGSGSKYLINAGITPPGTGQTYTQKFTVDNHGYIVASGATFVGGMILSATPVTSTAGNYSYLTLNSSTGAIEIASVTGTTGTTITGANPTASLGLTAINGTATTFMRSDAAPALSQAISPTWTGYHTFNSTTTITSGSSNMVGIYPTINLSGTGSYKALSIYSYEQALGTGQTNYLLALGTTTASGGTGARTDKMTVDSSGNLTITGNFNANNAIGVFATMGTFTNGVKNNTNFGLTLNNNNNFANAGDLVNVGYISTSSGTSGMYNTFAVYPNISQSGTSGYRGIFISSYENHTGSGSRLLIDAGTNSAAWGSGTHTSKFTLDSTGVLTIGVTPTTSTAGNYSYLTRNTSTGAIEVVSGGTTGGTSAISLSTSGASNAAATLTGGVYLNIPTLNRVVREQPSGTQDGVNTVFTLANTPISNQEEVFKTGILLEPGSGNDYTITGATLTFATAPAVGERIRVSYIY